MSKLSNGPSTSIQNEASALSMDGKRQSDQREEDRKVDEIVSYIRSLGLEKLADDISDERFARRILNAQVDYNFYSIQSQISQDRSEKALQFAVSIQASLYDKAASYTNVVVTLGYAGFFAIWNIVADELGSRQNALIGALLGTSLMIFIGWTITNSIILTMSIRRYAVIESAEFASFDDELKAHQEAEDKVKRSVLRLQRFWPVVFITTITLALFPGLLLLAELLFHVAGLELRLIDRIWFFLVAQNSGGDA